MFVVEITPVPTALLSCSLHLQSQFGHIKRVCQEASHNTRLHGTEHGSENPDFLLMRCLLSLFALLCNFIPIVLNCEIYCMLLQLLVKKEIEG